MSMGARVPSLPLCCRPTAAEAARRLQDITDKLSEEGHDAS